MKMRNQRVQDESTGWTDILPLFLDDNNVEKTDQPTTRH